LVIGAESEQPPGQLLPIGEIGEPLGFGIRKVG
jgi:hypothetical protein